MNKKFTRVISAILSVMMIFACAVTASAEEGTTPAPAAKIEVEIRVEGLSKTLAEKEIEVDKLSTLKAAIDAAALDVVYAEDGLTIKSVKGEAEVTTSKWQYAVNGVIRTDKLNACVLENDAEVILYNATEDAVIPSFDATDVATGGVVVFNGTDKAGNVAPIKGATVTWQTSLLSSSTYTTDSKGRILISDTAELYEGEHDVSIMKTNAYDVPEIVRMDDMEVNVPKLENVGSGENKTLFEEIYDFFYSILKGVVEVWGFYINAILGLFGLPPIESLLGETTPAA
ncbi:MAG: hypothetical protein IKL16_05940 [Clostridia bacterium]|nr:hypothetical protein [Clostridia bacterium]